EKMAYETITVRMNRSSATIPWGISIRGGTTAAPLVIASVEKDSLADKAGIEVNDTITTLAGRNVSSMSLQEARDVIERPSDEIYMLLQRYITSHPTLPWTLTEQDNRIVVDQVRPHDSAKYKSTLQGNETRNQYSAHSVSSYEVPQPARYDSCAYHGSSYSKFVEDKRTDTTAAPHGYQAAPFTNVTNTSSLDSKTHMREGFHNSYTTESYTKTETHEGVGDGYRSQQQSSQQTKSEASPGTRNVPIAVGYTSSMNAQSPPPVSRSPSQQNAFKASTMIPVHVNANPDSSFAQHSPISPYRRTAPMSSKTETSYRDEGRHIAFQHSPRTRRQLSPSASIRHLQYNSPINLYSTESATEQYLRQTGGLFGTESGTHIEPLQHVYASQRSPAIVKPIADRATPNSSPAFATGGGVGAHEAVTTFKSQSADRGESIPQEAPTAPTQQSAIPIPIIDSIPAPPPAPPSQAIPAPPPPPPAPSTTFSAEINPIKPPSAKIHAGSGIEREYSPPIRHTATADEGGARKSQSPRTRREVSPQATIRHLQYNSPMNIYSIESAAEQYLRQTGGLFGTETDTNRLKSSDPSYLHSETRRLIEEEERGVNHETGTPAQSSSFKRISAACGTPVD
uniref:Zasp-like motif domain-containing protein n=1 Tax=Parascaris univalens TaxID=6257 RepID=A0A915A5U7_PARUN